MLSPVPAHLKDWLELITYLVAIIAALGSAWQYRRNSRQERTKWLFDLYQHFYERPDPKQIRKRIEKGEKETKFAADEEDLALLEKLDDYLNFFEFIAGLRKRGVLSLDEIRDVFEYPLRKIATDKNISRYVSKAEYGYEGIRELARELGYPVQQG